MEHHVITPLNRFENFGRLTDLLRPHGIQWHVITDNGASRVSSDEQWIHGCNVQNNEGPFWARCNHAINWFLDHHSLRPRDRYCLLNDDDAYEPGFFEKVRSVAGEVVAVSMKRGDQTPGNVIPERAHGTNTLVADPENMRVGHVGAEQLMVSGRILSQCRLPIHICGDGQMIEYIAATNPVTYLPEAYVWFNYLEPGRWNP